MKSFLDWLKEEKLALPELSDATPSEENLEGSSTDKTVEEKTKRTGLSGNYPPAYVSDQYPHKYFNPIKATTDLDIQNMKK
jgi:hypothetical protein